MKRCLITQKRKSALGNAPPFNFIVHNSLAHVTCPLILRYDMALGNEM